MTWQPIKTAPRDGTNILIAFGQDGVSQAKYVVGLGMWQFLDTNDGVTWMVNHAKDALGGPSHWMTMPQWPEEKHVGGSGFGEVGASMQAEAPRATKDAETRLFKFLDAAGGEGLVLDGVDAGDLFFEMFPDWEQRKSQGEAP